MNFRKISSAKWDQTLWPDSTMASDMLFSTAAWRQGWTVGIVTFSRKGNFYMVRVLSKYSRCISSLIASLVTGVPSFLVALKNILGVWQYSSQMIYILQQRKSSSFSFQSSTSPPSSTIISSSAYCLITFSSTFFQIYFSSRFLLSRRLQRLFYSRRYCWCQGRYLEWQLLFSEGFHCQSPQILIRWSPASLNSLGESSPFYWKTSFQGGGLSFLPIS